MKSLKQVWTVVQRFSRRLQLFVKPRLLECGLERVKQERRNDEGKGSVHQAAGQLGEHLGGHGVQGETIDKLTKDKGLEHIKGDVGKRAEDAADDDLGVVGRGGRILARCVIADQTGDEGDGALVDEGDDALGAPAGDDIVQAGTQAGSQEAGAGAKEQTAEHAQGIGHMQLRTHERNAEIIDDKDDCRHQTDEADFEGFVAAVCHDEDPFHCGFLG